ncbi:hypothetical protein ACOMHN_067560 [Nucella lapillus]
MDAAAKFRALAQYHTEGNSTIVSAVSYVRKFIIDRRRILYGGLAIDLALRHKNAQPIYDDEELPDYDFYSPQNVQDAYDLADILFEAGFKNVSAIRAIHTETMRVRVDFVPVADITCIAPDIKLQTLEYEETLFVHPHFQYLDIHTALSFPLNAPPKEDIYNRFEKDVRRFNMLWEHYPFEAKSTTKFEPMSFTLPLGDNDVAVTGVLAYAIYHESIKQLQDAANIKLAKKTPLEKFIDLEAQLKDGDKWTLNAVGPPSIVRSSYHEKDVVKRSPAVLGIRAPSLQLRNGMVIFLSKYKPLAITPMRFQGHKVNVVCIQYLLRQFLYEALMMSGPVQEQARILYAELIRMIHVAEEALLVIADDFPDPYLLPFTLSVMPLPNVSNCNEAYRILLTGAVNSSGVPILDPNAPELVDLRNTSTNYYPDGVKTHPNIPLTTTV